MTVDKVWFTRDKWTLIEAALICAGINPYAGEKPTDNPHTVLSRIEDARRRELFNELYARSKDALGGTLRKAEESRTGAIGNSRVWPFDYLRWGCDASMPAHIRKAVDLASLSNTIPSPVPSVSPHSDWTQDPNVENKYGYTIDGAARELKRCGVDEEAMRVQLRTAIFAQELLVVDQGTGITQPSGPRELRDFHSRIRTSDLNAWLEKKGVEYRLGTSEPEERGNSQLPLRIGVSRTRIIDGFMVKRTDAENKVFWDDKLSRPPRWLAGALVSVGKPGKSSFWNPALVAHALLGKKLMSLKSLDAVMKNFPEWEPEWREQTELDRQ